MTDPARPGPMQLPQTWTAVAPGYVEETAWHFGAYAREMLRRWPVARTDRILDVAAGPGTLSFVVAPDVARVVAVDFSPGMIAEGRARAVRDGVSNVHGAVMNAEALALRDASFDAAYCLFAFMFFPDRARAFRELYRVVRPGGRAVVATWAPIARRPFMKVGMDALAEAMPEIPPMQKGDLQSPEDCIREMSEAGFEGIEVATFSASVHVESAEHYLRIMQRSGPGFALLAGRMGEDGVARFLTVARRLLAETGPDLAAEALLSIGRRPA